MAGGGLGMCTWNKASAPEVLKRVLSELMFNIFQPRQGKRFEQFNTKVRLFRWCV